MSETLFQIIGGFALLMSVVMTSLIVGKQQRAASRRRWLLEHGNPGKARILSVRDTNVRDSRDHFILEVAIEPIEPQAARMPRTIRAAVSPLDFHRVGAGEEVAIRLHPDGSDATLDLPASRS